jgi:REP element-mobilizing transposase RayT
MIYRNRGYLPHLEVDGGIYFVTFRLAGSLSSTLLESWRSEKQDIIRMAHQQNRELSDYEKRRIEYLHLERIEDYLDAGKGECWLKNPDIAQIVNDALKFFNKKRYTLHAWCIMPNHVHVLFSPMKWQKDQSLDCLMIPILHSWKSFTANKANRVLNREGKFWQEEYFDTLVKSDRQFAFYVNYTLKNPVTAKLCNEWTEWRWSGCSEEIRNALLDESGGLEARAPSLSENLL